ncbi:MAG: bifunctional NADP-dependent methylenetetrahydromethanopterin dehydrogenase/methylenetetrahydrofolate dehydrogenase [Planctomycetaceae bacterium]|nr:bifunctional NADP-dependent methylenetetrahydromethanopterin dehydrogenase/methylenetetrahydrofolate dehydrogenase [Planctomycetaceae bacterium]
MKKILIQLDTDTHPSTFDRVVAVDAGVDELFSYSGITPENVTGLVHGAMFTRGPKQLQNTAIFIGGSNVHEGEELLETVTDTFFGPVSVSVMMDSNGSNTTAAAAVLSAGQHLDFDNTTAAILGGTGPVGQRAAELLAARGATVKLYSRSLSRAESTCRLIQEKSPGATLEPCELKPSAELASELEGSSLLIAAGAAGVQFIEADHLQQIMSLKVAVDLNAVPPTGLGGIEVMDKAFEKLDCLCYGAIGVGGLKMKIHKAAVEQLFLANDQVFSTEEIYGIGESLLKS